MAAWLPLLVAAASDPVHDLVACEGGTAQVGDPPDLIDAQARTDEGGSGFLVRLTFAEPLRVPDTSGRPFRVDVVLNDPSVPTMSFGYYRDINRILRYDAVRDPQIKIYLLPERGENVFYGVAVDGATLTLRVPGRLITRDMDMQGPRLERLRWGAIVRDGHRCDRLGNGRASFRVVAGADDGEATLPPVTSAGVSDPSPSASPVAPFLALVIAAAIATAMIVWFIRRRSGR